MNSLFNRTNSQNNLNPMQIMQQMQNYQGTPEQAKQEFFNQCQQMGMNQSQINSTLNQIENLAKQFGFI